MLPAMDAIIDSMTKLSLEFADAAMLARTHGQTASPTTMGKEFANVAYRLARQRKQVATITTATPPLPRTHNPPHPDCTDARTV